MTPHLIYFITLLQCFLVFKNSLRGGKQCEVNIGNKQKEEILSHTGDAATVQDRTHISHICIKVSPPPTPPLFSVSKIDGSRLAVPARHPILHMLAAMFSHPAQLEADTELRHLNTYCPHTLYLCHTGFHVQFIPGECIICYTPKDLLYAAALHALK